VIDPARPPPAPDLAEGAGVVLLVSTLAGLWLWPLPVVWPTALAVAPEGEGVAHLWSWWALDEAGALIGAHVERIAVPDGLWVHGIDPLHGVLFGLARPLGPGAGFALVQVVGLLLAGLAGWALAREAGADRGGRLLAAVLGSAAPTVVGAAADGITEGLGVGWVGLQLAALLALLRSPRAGLALAWALCLGAAAWSGPYNAVFSAMVAVPVLGLQLRRAPDRLRWVLPAGLTGLALAAPVLRAAVSLEAGRPGAAGRAPPERPATVVDWRGAWREGADLLDLLLPDWLTGGVAAAPTTAYLGLGLLGLAALAGARRERTAAWPWLLGGGAAATVALGPWLVVAGEPVVLLGRELRPPVAGLELLPLLGRLSRWYRAGAVATLLLVPAAALAVRGWPRWRVGLVALLVVLDLRLGSPVPWPLPVVPVPQDTVLEGVSGPFLELPRVHPLRQAGQLADENLLLQVVHGEATSATRNNRSTSLSESPELRQLERVVRRQPVDGVEVLRQVAPELRALGYRALVLYPDRLPAGAPGVVEAALGPPVARDSRVVVFLLPSGSSQGG
jgi:hypothetical protein